MCRNILGHLSRHVSSSYGLHEWWRTSVQKLNYQTSLENFYIKGGRVHFISWIPKQKTKIRKRREVWEKPRGWIQDQGTSTSIINKLIKWRMLNQSKGESKRVDEFRWFEENKWLLWNDGKYNMMFYEILAWR